MKRRTMAAVLVFACFVSVGCATDPRSVTKVASPEASSEPSPEASVESAGSTPEASVESPGSTPKASPESPTPAWDQPPNVDTSSGKVAIGDFNAYLESAEPTWAHSALRTALEFLLLDEADAQRVRVLVERASLEPGNDALVTVIRDGLADDSVRAIRYRLDLERQSDETWRLRSARWAQRCWDGRGHQDFSTELCV